MSTAYAAFTSLMHLIAQLREHPYPPIKLEEKQVDSLNSQICFFQRFLEDHHSTIDHELDIRIANSAHAAEDLIETHIADRVLDFYGSLERVIEGIDLVKKEVMEMNQNEQSQQGDNRPTRYPMLHASSQSSNSTASGENFVVGIKDTTTNIVDKLTSSQSKSGRQIISISGMGGIGKTTLARHVYDHPCIKDYFDFFAWATISKDYNTHESLVEILHCLDRSMSKKSLREMSEYDLGERLYQYLIGRRYLVILDDMWDFEAWERMRSFFPASSGSGIVITSRESKFSSISSHSFRMDLLDKHKSWDLFCKHVFGQDCCPVELENAGKKIANNCRGLPLSIVVIGSHLAKSPRTQDYWEYVAQNLTSVVNSKDEDRCLKIVSLSYTHLPVHLKPCFLYMAIFSEDEEINVSRLIKLWVVEGFVKPINRKSLEDTSRDYLNDLVDRNLILAHKSSLRGKMKSCKIHDLLRDFCLKEASKKNFICKVQKLNDLIEINNKQRIVVHPSSLEKVSTTDLVPESQRLLKSIETQDGKRSSLNEPIVNRTQLLIRILIFGENISLLENKLLTVLASYDQYSAARNSISHTMVTEILHEMLNVRYFEVSINGFDKLYNLPLSISLLWNLQYLIMINPRSVTKAPPEIWKMHQLRRIKIDGGVILSNPPSKESNDIITMENLQSVQYTINFSFCEEVIKRIPNIKKLWVAYWDAFEGFDEGLCTLNKVDRLQKLESFTCYIRKNEKQSYCFHMLQNLTFPHSLKVLKVGKIHWNDVTTKIGSLPLLEFLFLAECEGHEWELVERRFPKLNYLKLFLCRSLQYLSANNNHFPCLQHLSMVKMKSLEGISSEIGDIATLESIELWWCPESAVISAKEIAVEQYDHDNQHLQVRATMDEGYSLSESLISSCNFHIKIDRQPNLLHKFAV